MPDLDRRIVLEGTHRARTPEETWRNISPLLARYGITRVADVTGLDCIGIPVYVAVRPESETLAVSQGKGSTPLLAKLSAVMESIELWHAERPPLPLFSATPEVTAGHYPLGSLGTTADPRLYENICLDWYTGKGMTSGQPVPLPADLVRTAFSQGRDWRPRIFTSGSNGLASGNTTTEAALHALYEVIERDVVATLTVGGNDTRQHITPKTIPSAHCQEFISKLDHAGVALEVAMIPNNWGVPTSVAFIWSHDYPVICAGSGSHSDPLVAVSRAISEAVQSRLTRISGTRDDIESHVDAFEILRDPPLMQTSGAAWNEIVTDTLPVQSSLSRELQGLTETIAARTGLEPVMVDLSSDPSFSVVKVVCPGLAYTHRGYVPR